MVQLINLGHLLLFTTIFVHYSNALPVLESPLIATGYLHLKYPHLSKEDVRGVARSYADQLSSPLVGDVVDALLEDTARLSRHSGLQTRQLGDIEFSNRYGEYLKSKAKISTICSFLHRMQSVRKSGMGGDTDRVKELLSQYTCPTGYQWPADL